MLDVKDIMPVWGKMII